MRGPHRLPGRLVHARVAARGLVLVHDDAHRQRDAQSHVGLSAAAMQTRAIALRADGHVGLHGRRRGRHRPFGGAPGVGGGPSWPGADVARAIALRANGTSGYVLDHSGGIHPFGGAPPRERRPLVARQRRGPRHRPARQRHLGLRPRPLGRHPPLRRRTRGERRARRGPAPTSPAPSSLRANGTSGYVLDHSGGIHPFGGAPGVTGGPYWPGQDVATGLVLGFDGQIGLCARPLGGGSPLRRRSGDRGGPVLAGPRRGAGHRAAA